MEHLLGRAATSFFILIAILCGRINKANGQVYCPGQTSIPCLTSTQPILWDGTAFDGQCPSSSPSDTIVLNELTTANIGNTFTCGQYTVVFDNVEVVMDGGFNVTQFSSSLRFTASSSLNGLTIQCRTAGNQNAPSVDITNIIVPDIPTPIVSTSQDSLTSVTVNLTVIDTRCASLYVVEVTPEGGAPIIMNSSTSTLSVSGLDLCLNSYSVVGYIQASTGIQGSGSSRFNIPSDITGIGGVVNVTFTQLALEWTQLPNSAPPTCITGYRISWDDGVSVVGDFTSSGNSTSLSANQITGFPYCQTLSVTIAPNTPKGVFTDGSSSSTGLIQHPEFQVPNVSAFVSLRDGTFWITISLQEMVTVEGVPNRMYGLVRAGSMCQPQTSYTGISATMQVPDAASGNQYSICFLFRNNECMETVAINITVPEQVITNSVSSVGVDELSVTVMLPVNPPMNHTLWFIYSTITPFDAVSVLVDYPSTGQQYTVTFSGLIPGTEYTYDIRIVLRADTSSVIGLPVTGVVTIPSPGCGVGCIVGIVLAISLVVMVLVAIVVVTVVCCNKPRGKKGEDSEDGLELSASSDKPKSKKKNKKMKDNKTSDAPPVPDSIYADPATIEHVKAPETDEQYAVVDLSAKKNRKVQTIEHEVAPSGETYAVVNKPKRDPSAKKRPMAENKDVAAERQPSPAEYSNVSNDIPVQREGWPSAYESVDL